MFFRCGIILINRSIAQILFQYYDWKLSNHGNNNDPSRSYEKHQEIVMPICQLCGETYPKLNQSHIVPKLVYKRIKKHTSSRFRDLNRITLPLQDGEKHEMLCDSCEEIFSKFETKFAAEFFDPYRHNGKFTSKDFSAGWLGNYIASVSWRILRDDLYRPHSFENDYFHSLFEDFEHTLRCHFNEFPVSNTLPHGIKNYVFTLQEICKRNPYSSILDGVIFGYPNYDSEFNLLYACSYYAGLCFVTTYSAPSPRLVYIREEYSVTSLLRKTFLSQKRKLQISLQKEFDRTCVAIAEGYTNNVTPEIQNKIKKYYQSKT